MKTSYHLKGIYETSPLLANKHGRSLLMLLLLFLTFFIHKTSSLTLDVSTVGTSTPGHLITDQSVGECSVAVNIGDFNGDEKPDYAIGCWNGGVYIIYGTNTSVITSYNIPTYLTSTQGGFLIRATTNGRFGYSVAPAGDLTL